MSQKTINRSGRMMETNDQRNDHRTKEVDKCIIINNSVLKLVNKQVVSQNTFAVLGDLAEEEIDQIINPKHSSPDMGKGGNLGKNQSVDSWVDNCTVAFLAQKSNKKVIKQQVRVMKTHDTCDVANCTPCVEKISRVQDLNEVEQSRDTQNKVDVKNSVQITRAVLNGNNTCIHHVNVLDIKDKCVDLKRCFSQKKKVFGFLPITNLKRMRIGHSLTPNKVLSHSNFDPVHTHKAVHDIGGKNFEKAKIQLPSHINFDLLDKLCVDYWDYQLPYF